MGKLIPAGTGVRGYNDKQVYVEGQKEAEAKEVRKPRITQTSIESLAALL